MSVALTNWRWSLKGTLPWAALGLCLLALLLSNVWHDTLFHGRSPVASPAVAEPPPSPQAAPAAATTVTLPEGKFKVAGVRTEPARTEVLPVEVGVAGRIEANPDRRVEIRPRAAGVVREVHALLGQKVKKGDVLVVLDSPDVGTARLNLRARQRELVTARIEADWKNQVAANVARLIPELRKGVTAATIEQQYADRPLGSNRALLLQAYAEFEIASHEAEKTSGLRKHKIIGEHPFFVAQHTREGAQAKFEAALEQVRFDANQQKLLADQQVRHAEAAVIDAAQRLRILGVSEDIAHLLAHAERRRRRHQRRGRDRLPDRRPVRRHDHRQGGRPQPEGRDERRPVHPGRPLDRLGHGQHPRVGLQGPARPPGHDPPDRRRPTPAGPSRPSCSRSGRMVDPTTRTVPLLAETPNPDGLLKLGMFVRIVLDGADHRAHRDRPHRRGRRDRGPEGRLPPLRQGRADLHLPACQARPRGGRPPGRPLRAHQGEMVVSSGAFFLKSELILQNETEED